MAERVGYFWEESLSQRKVSYACPEKPERCEALHPQTVLGLAGGDVEQFGFTARDSSILEAVHELNYIDKVRNASANNLRYLDAGETMVTPDLFPQALHSASAGVEAMERILRGSLKRAFCAIRPPGHHANRMRAMGFCVFNNLAIAATHARNHHGINRILIVDWDVHPGNGTQEVFWDDPQVFTLSIHQDNLMAESGLRELTGRGAGKGFNRNEPVPAGVAPEKYLAIFQGAVREVAQSFRPELLLIAAGFDAHQSDPSSNMKLQAEHFGMLTESVLDATRAHTGGKTLSLLEGGYNLNALQNSVAAHLRALAA